MSWWRDLALFVFPATAVVVCLGIIAVVLCGIRWLWRWVERDSQRRDD